MFNPLFTASHKNTCPHTSCQAASCFHMFGTGQNTRWPRHKPGWGQFHQYGEKCPRLLRLQRGPTSRVCWEQAEEVKDGLWQKKMMRFG